MEPLRREVRDERARSRIGEHAPHLLLEHARLMQLSRNRHVQQLIVWNAAPEEEGESRRELYIADAIRSIRCSARWILLDAE